MFLISFEVFSVFLTVGVQLSDFVHWVLVLENFVNGERSDDSFCAVLHRHSFPSIVFSSQGISALLPMALFCFKHPHSWTLFITIGGCKRVIFGLLNAMSLESCNAHFQQALTASNQHIICYMESNATTAECVSLQSFNDLQHIEWPLLTQ